MRHEPPVDEVLALAGHGPAIRHVLLGLAERPGLLGSRDARIAATIQAQASDVSLVVSRLGRWGWISADGGTGRRLRASSEDLRRLADRLTGMFEALHLRERPQVVPIVTLPERAKALRTAMERDPSVYETKDGFAHVASRARRRLVLLMPFVDGYGVKTLCEMVRASIPATVIVRPDSKGERHYLKHLPALRECGVSILEYWVEHSGGADGNPIETFHAKLVVADDDLVYVGSSNLMVSSLERGLECGVILEGEPARPFISVADAVVSVSKRV